MNVLAVFAHPDDEVLGAGASLAMHALAGDVARSLAFTNGVGARWTDDSRRRSAEYAKACTTLGIVQLMQPSQEEFPDQMLDVVGILKVAREIERVIKGVDVIYTHWPNDLNQDHRIVAQAVLVAARPSASSVTEILGCEIVETSMWGAFHANVFREVSEEAVALKLAAIEAYESEARLYPHPRSARAAGERMFGYGGAIGVLYAEAFSALRMVTRL